MAKPTAPHLGDTLLRSIGAAAIAMSRADPHLLDRLISDGRIDVRFAGADPANSPDPVGLIRDLGSALGDAFAADPGLVQRLGFDALDLLRRDAVGPSGSVARAERVQRTMAAVEFDPAGQEVSSAIIESRGVSVVRHLGGVRLLAFESGSDAVHALLDLRDATHRGFRAAAASGEVMASGNDVFGPVVATACRMAGVAEPGQILITPQLRDPLGVLTGVSFDVAAPRQFDDGDPVSGWAVRRS